MKVNFYSACINEKKLMTRRGVELNGGKLKRALKNARNLKTYSKMFDSLK